MSWVDKIIAVHTAVTDQVSHGGRLKSERYFVWQEAGANDFVADGQHCASAITGMTDFFTKREFDPWVEAFEASLNRCQGLTWRLNSIQYEEDTGFTHYEWEWEVLR